MQPEPGAATSVTAENVDLSNCDKEIIHMPGMIQPHGAMLVLRLPDLAILQASENTAALFGVPAPELTLKGLADMLGPDHAATLQRAISGQMDRLDRVLVRLLRLPCGPGGKLFDVLAHRAGEVLILELELVDAAPPEPMDLYPAIIACAGRLQSVPGLQAFLDLAVTEVRGLTGFDRVMVFQFTEDGGKIVAEDRGDDPVAYLGKHFPPSDVPAPARRLFALSWLRHLPDADYVPVPLVPRIDEPVDMSVSLLRHVSVMYTGWLKNIRARAAMVMPLMKDGRLWGVMTCMHHAGPKHVAYETRTAVEFLSNMVSLQMAEQEDRDTAAYRRRMQDAVAVMVNQMTQEPEYQNGLIRGGVTLHGWMDAPGAALVTEDGVRLLGDAPTEAEVRGIAAWLQEQHDAAPVFATDRLPKLYAAAEAFKAAASGLLAARPIRSRHEFVMWFRPELVHTVNWAGDPRKPVQVTVVDGEARLTPRTSFELWKQEVRGRSAAWLDCEIEAAGALRQVMAEVVLIRLNEELRRSNSELDTFAYGASHDLKEPLRGIYNFATFLQRSAVAKLTGEEAGRIQTILRLTRRMDDLTDALLQYSRIGRTDFDLEAVDLNELLRQTLDLLAPRIAETKTEIRTPHPLPALKTDARMLTGVFSELIINAMKYTDRPAGERWIEIGCRHQDGRRVFYVRDNGIGIAKQHLDQVFQIFRRLHPRDEYGGGSGAGLTIARRTMERLGGRLWAESDGVGKGATFVFSPGAASINDSAT